MALPFTPAHFFEVFAAYNRVLWPFALALWLYALAGVIVFARSRDGSRRFVVTLLALQWAWVALAYHAAFFSRINPAAWLFAGFFLTQSVLFVWLGIVRAELHFSSGGSPRHVVAWALIIYSLVYPAIVQLEGHAFPAAPTFGVPCPTTLLTIGFLLAADPPWPRVIAIVPVAWTVVAGSAAVLFGVRADLMLWVAGIALTAGVLVPVRSVLRA